jgi:outer membrane murein-binding lipoprotein Lpp
MFIRRSHLGAALAALLLSGCSTISNTADSVWSSLTGEDETSSTSSPSSSSSGGGGTVVAIPPSPAESNPQPTLGQAAPQPPALGSNVFAAAPVTPGSPTGTIVGAKVQELRGDLQRLKSDINRQNGELQQVRQTMARDAAAYYSLVGTINSRLQIGTTPGNPQLVAQWNQAQGSLDRMSTDVAKLNSLSNQVASDSSLAAYILQSIHAAYQLQGAVDEDHRQLRELETEVNATTALTDQLLGALSDDISRQTAYVGQERANLVTLSLAIKNGELYGQNLSERSFGGASARASRGRPLPAVAEHRPLVIIRFDRPNVAYEQALYSAVRRALQRRPDATFDLVAVTPNAGTPAQVALHTDASKRNAENVMRSLTSMGLAADRISLSATTSTSVRSDEVQIYVR